VGRQTGSFYKRNRCVLRFRNLGTMRHVVGSCSLLSGITRCIRPAGAEPPGEGQTKVDRQKLSNCRMSENTWVQGQRAAAACTGPRSFHRGHRPCRWKRVPWAHWRALPEGLPGGTARGGSAGGRFCGRGDPRWVPAEPAETPKQMDGYGWNLTAQRN